MPLKVKCVDICSGVENVAEPKPINYILENLSHKWICPVCRNHNSVISSSFWLILQIQLAHTSGLERMI